VGDKAQADVGIDFGILNNTITGTVDYYQKNYQQPDYSIPVAAGT